MPYSYNLSNYNKVGSSMNKALLEHYEVFVDNSNNCYKLAVATLNESYRWLAQSFEESKSFTCSFKEHVNGCELNYFE